MSGLKHITGFLCSIFCMLNLVGFSQDSTNVSEQISIVKKPAVEVQKSQNSTKTGLFSLPKEKNPKLATWLSVALPGAGQVYNGQWWKVPIIYAGVGALIYFHKMNVGERNLYQKEYRGRMAGDSLFVPHPDLKNYNTEQIRDIRNYYQRNIELVYIASGVLYILNIIDACVFAHLSTFDVSENLSLHVQPFATPDLTPYAANQRLPMQGGLRLTFTLK